MPDSHAHVAHVAHDAADIRGAARSLLRAIGLTFGPHWQAIRLWLDRAGLAIGGALLTLCYLHHYARSPVRPSGLVAGQGWWDWYDQSKTLEAVLALRAGDLSAAHQWYPPLYAICGALGAAVSGHHPFLLVNLAGLLASFLLSVAILDALGLSRLTAIILFVAVTVLDSSILDAWVVPWNTVLSIPLELLGLLSALRMLQGDRQRRWPFALGLAIGLLPALRPSDVLGLAPAAIAVIAHLTVPVVRRRPGASGALVGDTGLGLTGLVLGAAVTVGLHLAIWGRHAGGYVEMSRELGFDWRLIGLHWVTLVVDPRPVFGGATALIEVWWWLVPGLAGIVWAVLAARAASTLQRRTLAVVLGGIVLHWMLYLAYRDLHPRGLWRFHNYHYFVWTLPFIAAFAWAWVKAGIAWSVETLRRRPHVHPVWTVLAGGVVALLAICWRTQLTPVTSGPLAAPVVVDAAARTVSLPAGLPGLRDALLLPMQGSEDNIYFDAALSLDAGGRQYHDFFALRAFPVPGGAMILPLRPLPAGPATLSLGPKISLPADGHAVIAHLSTEPGLPCWLPHRLLPAACHDDAPLPGFPLPPHQLDFDGRSEPNYLIAGGWSDPANGRWTVGYHSELRFKVPSDVLAQQPGVIVEVEAAGFIPRGAPMIEAVVSANGTKVAEWHVGSTAPVALRAAVPRAAIAADGTVRLDISVLNARRPSEYDRHSDDRRLLGLRLLALRLLPWSQGAE
ncbi:hypothetical protein FHR90_000308 [Endobacter medicaginis]|uniref:Uncharacterized protein n=3 Tax=Endobacter medicaginis TaxID=1181271 RepID=A0A839UYP4_9PROT|nr:hypothetical protein [Endobacter medicaginis]MBB3172502.1 hypothetical protein [Endobacter medicaginis]MCX5474010.1 hypothetical protein [Endobacter medicaginis]